jgi:hypothetical protein
LFNRSTRSQVTKGAIRLEITISRPHEFEQLINLHGGVHMTAIEDCRATQFMRPLSILCQYRRHTSRTAARARIKCTVLTISLELLIGSEQPHMCQLISLSSHNGPLSIFRTEDQDDSRFELQGTTHVPSTLRLPLSTLYEARHMRFHMKYPTYILWGAVFGARDAQCSATPTFHH